MCFFESVVEHIVINTFFIGLLLGIHMTLCVVVFLMWKRGFFR